jgi:Lon protease-like protein
MNLARLACAIWIAGLLLVPRVVSAQPPAVSSQGVALPSIIPIFPLGDATLFPHIIRQLMIFEPRYRSMVADALKGDRIIGMVMLQPGHDAEYEGRPPIYPIGCAGVIADAEELPDGRYTIVLRGLVKFRVTSEDQSRLYRLARVEAMPETPNDEERAALRIERQRLLPLVGLGSEPAEAELTDEDLVNAFSQHLPLAPIDRQYLLEQNGPLSRAKALVELLERR